MKQTAIVFAGADEKSAKTFAITLNGGEWAWSIASAYSFNRKEVTGKAFVMPDVPNWHRDRIFAAYPDAVMVGVAVKPTVKHRGFGRFYVMRGDKVISGPHSKQEAQSLVK